MTELTRRIRQWLRWRRADDELAEELEFHRAMTQRRLETAGVPAGDAAAAARRALGSGALAADRARDVWVPAWAQDVWRDVRFAARMLTRERAFTAAIVTVLGLGIGTVSLQSVLVDAVCIRGLPIPDVDRVLFVDARDSSNRDVAVSYREFDRIRAGTGGVQDVSAFASTPAVLGDDDRASDRVLASYVSAPIFHLLRERPRLGRDFATADDRPEAPPVAILAAGVWQSRYGGDPAVIGRSIRVNGTPTTIIGVMREPFRFPSVTDVWLPLSSMPGVSTEHGTARALSVVMRLDTDATLAGVRSALLAASAELARDFPAANTGVVLGAIRINERYNGRLTDPVWIAFTLVGAIVLLIACANAANMLLLRASSRSHEIAVRASLGASRWRIVRQLIVESALVAVLGGALGAALSAAGLHAINAIIPENTLAYWMRFRLDLRALAALGGVSSATVAVFGVAPALHLATSDLNEAIKSGGRGGFGVVRGRRWTVVCLAAECGLTMVMLAALVVSVRTAFDEGRKFVAVEPAGILTSWVTLPADRYPTTEARRRFYRALEQRVAALPGTAAVAIATALPLGGAAPRTLAVEGWPPAADRTPPTVYSISVSTRYFDAVAVPTTRGRAFGDRDGLPGYETAIVNARFAEMFFSGADAIGRRMRLMDPSVPDGAGPTLTIVGVVPSVRQRATSANPDPLVYLPLASAPPASAVLVVRARPSLARTRASVVGAGASDATLTTALLRDAVHDVDAELPLYRTMALARAIEASQWNGRVSEGLLDGITLVAVALASFGLYAVIAHAIVQRTREIGIRVALGATRRRIVSMVARQSAVHLACGVAAGIVSVFAFARLTAGPNAAPATDYEMSSASTIAAVAVLLAAITAVASIAPAWRACHIDPAQTLREG